MRPSCRENAVPPGRRQPGWRAGQGTPVFRPAPLRAAGREGVLPSSGMVHVSARTPPGRAGRERRSSDRHRPAQRGERAYFPVPGWCTSRHVPHPAERAGNAGLQTGTAPRSGARGRTSQFRDGARLGTYPTRQSGTPARERRPPVGIAREREPTADDAALCQLEFRTPFQSRMPRPLTVPLPGAAPFSCPAG